ncbi:MAG: aspartyl protease family protein [Bacteroidota bacterium]
MPLLLALLLAASVAAQTPRSNPDAGATAYVGGQWWNGEAFAPRDTTWAVDGVFVDARPEAVDRTVRLGDAHVVPPYGDAHTHMLSDPWSGPSQADLFERDGVFYALVLTNRYTWAVGVMDRFEGPGSIDVAYAHGGLTSTDSHPAQVYEWQSLGLIGQELTPERQRTVHESRLAEDDAYWFLDALTDVETSWGGFLAHAPDAVKVYLLDVAGEEGAATSGLTGLPSGRGLSPEVLRDVVRRAHAAGLPVHAHVETAADARHALDAGVDGLAHLPGYGLSGPEAPYVLDEATIAAMGARSMVVAPTARVTADRPGDRPAREARARDLLRRMTRQLHAAGARIVLGADRWNETSRTEADMFVTHRFLPPATVLDLWTRVTPEVVFPGRAIGCLGAGYEASFLALACDPLADWSCTARITHREKQGARLGAAPDDMAEVAAAWEALDVDRFTAAPEASDGPLLRGLKALADADFGAAEAALTEALEAAPDSLRPFVHRRLAEVAAERFDWAEALRQRTAAGDDVSGGTMSGFARFPEAGVRFDAPEAVVPFDGLRATVRINGEEVRAIVDTGAPGSSVPRALAERLGLRVDTTARGRSVVPAMGLAFDTYAVLIDSVQVGAATFTNVPATVGWTDGDGVDGEVFLGANLFRHLAGAIRYDYADSTFTVVRDVPATDARPTFLIDGGSAPVVPVTVAGQAANAIVDTGNSASVYLATGAFDVPEAAYTRTASGTLSNGFEWSHRLYRLPFEIPGHPEAAHEAFEGGYVFSADDPITVILGRPVWAGGTLSLDFVNRRVRFDAR